METLLFVRHGTSAFNLERRFAGSTDAPLAPQGREEARAAGIAASALTIDCIVSSPLSRCRRTAEIIANEIGYPVHEVMVSELLVERGFGPLEGTPLRAESQIEDIEGVETHAELLDRAWKAHQWLESLDAPHLLVCGHGVFGRALRSTFRPEMPFVAAGKQGQRPSGIPNAVITCWRRACECCDYGELVAL